VRKNRTEQRYRVHVRKGISLFICVYLWIAAAGCESRNQAEEPPIITSATYQHTQYNGESQPIEARAAADTEPFVITYFTSLEDLEQDRGGTAEAPSAVGAYYARIRRPPGRGYAAGRDITVEYYIQKALVSISAEERQEYRYDGTPKPAAASADKPVELEFAYYPAENAAEGANIAGGSGPALPGPPAEPGVYRARVSFPGNAEYMGASRDIELVIR
jgi:hypothetical protein